MDFSSIISQIHNHIENDDVEKAVIACLRLARGAKDYMNAAIFLRELYLDKKEVVRMIYDDAPHLKEEALAFIAKTSLERWIEAHTIDFLDTDGYLDPGERKNLLSVAIGDIDPELNRWEGAIADMTLPSGMSPYDTAAFSDGFTRQKAEIRLRMQAIQTIKSRVKTRCLNYVIQMERQLQSQQKNQSFLEDVQNEVNNYFKAHSEDTFQKLQKAAQLSFSEDLEDMSLLLTAVRRALKAAADHFYPSQPDKVQCSDGKERLLDDEKYLNRLQEFILTKLPKATANELLKAELEHFPKRLNRIGFPLIANCDSN